MMLLETKSLTPKAIVAELDRHIVGQSEAKRAVAIALRNRWRRLQLPADLREEVQPKNILMVGTTGVGKTEIARRLAKLVGAPFIKVEATKFTEVGYVGRDVEQIIRDLMDVAVQLVRAEYRSKMSGRVQEATESRILDALTGKGASAETRRVFQAKLRDHELDENHIEIEIADAPAQNLPRDIPGMPGGQMEILNLNELFSQVLGKPKRTMKKVRVAEAVRLVMQEEEELCLDNAQIVQDAIEAVQQNGIVFLDEIDKICMRSEGQGGSVSREGVQRDLLPLIEGTSVATKYGTIKTDHVLFIASGAFQMSAPSDLLPELQGRLPIRVELNSLTEEDFVRILKEPEANLIRQAQALLATEGVTLNFTEDALGRLAAKAVELNSLVEDIGARRLYMLLEKVLETLSFSAESRAGETVEIAGSDVEAALAETTAQSALAQFIL